jgi:hypothetical protein
MPTVRFRSHRKKQPDLLQVIRDEIQDALEWKLYRGREFVPRDRLRAIWTADRLTYMADRYGAFHTSDISQVLSENIQVLSLLVDIQWEDWSAFRGIFLKHLGRTDEDIQANIERVLEDEELLGEYTQAIRDVGGCFILSTS